MSELEATAVSDFIFESGGRLNAGGKELLGFIAKREAERVLKSRTVGVGTVLTGDEKRDLLRLRALFVNGYRTRLSLVLHRWNERILRERCKDGKRVALYGGVLTPPPAGGLPIGAMRALASAERATAGGYPPTSSDGRGESSLVRSLLLPGGSSGVVLPSAARAGARPD